jgi:hypothetical protein
MSGWRTLRQVAWPELGAARLQAHWAAQPIAALGAAAVDPEPDDSHRSMTLVPGFGRLIGRKTRGGVQAALDIESLELMVQASDGARVDGLELAGNTLSQAMDWLGAAVNRASGEELERPIALQEYDLPDHPVAAGARFEANELTGEVAQWFVNAEAVLHAIDDPRRSPIRLWPHHFDLASLIALDGEGARSIGVGLSPGDAEVPRPYIYVSPWPRPERTELPELAAGGRWHREGWFGALLDAKTIVAVDEGEAQSVLVADFVASAVAAGRNLLKID